MSVVLADQARRRERHHPVADVMLRQIEFGWASMLQHALDLADRAGEATDRTERDRLLDHALHAYQFARVLRQAVCS